MRDKSSCPAYVEVGRRLERKTAPVTVPHMCAVRPSYIYDPVLINNSTAIALAELPSQAARNIIII